MSAPLKVSAKKPPNRIFPTQGILIFQKPAYSLVPLPEQISGSRELLLPRKLTSMAAPDVHHLFHHPIADHSFSADRQTLAVARDNNVELYTRSGSKFTMKDELKGHDKTVTSVDIAPTTGRIVTCSQG